jgi:hypothetical protein
MMIESFPPIVRVRFALEPTEPAWQLAERAQESAYVRIVHRGGAGMAATLGIWLTTRFQPVGILT